MASLTSLVVHYHHGEAHADLPPKGANALSALAWWSSSTTVVGVSKSQHVAQALIVVDVQAAFVSGATAVPAATSLLTEIGGLLHRAREGGALVVHLQNDGPAGSVDEPSTPGWELFLPIGDHGDEVVFRKSSDDGFYGTALADLLYVNDVRSLAICGLMSEMCVAATARTAMALGFHVVMPHDAHGTYDIPAVAGLADLVPARMVSRVAEWSLGDQIDIVGRAADVRFKAPERGGEEI